MLETKDLQVFAEHVYSALSCSGFRVQYIFAPKNK